MPFKIAVTATSFCKHQDLCKRLETSLSNDHVSFVPQDKGDLSGKGLTEFLKNMDFALVGKEKIDEQILRDTPTLKGIAKYGVGVDNIDMEACRRFGVEVYWEAGVNRMAVAEHTVGLMLALCRNIAKGDRLLHRGLWVKDGGRQLTGKTVGIIGCGHIGTEVGKILKAFQCPLQLCDIIDLTQKAEQLSAKVVTLDQLLQESDFISLHVPLTPETLNLIGEAQLQLMKPTSYLINTSRGKVVDQHALKIALISGQIAGAGLDVFSKEPLVDPELYQLENLVLTPHSAGNSAEAVLAMGEAAIRGIQSLIVACKKELV